MDALEGPMHPSVPCFGKFMPACGRQGAVEGGGNGKWNGNLQPITSREIGYFTLSIRLVT